jgi:hypothetical protein
MPSMIIKPRSDETGAFHWVQNVPPAKVIHLTNEIEVGSLEAGMESGKPSVVFVFTLPDGRVVMAETSLELFVAAANGLAAAHANDSGVFN